MQTSDFVLDAMSVKKEKERGAFSQSFVMGVISLVFLIIGYQTALLIHSSALTRIAANRDVPDTVYVYREIVQENNNTTVKEVSVPERRNAVHSPRAQAVRKNLPRKTVESFSFNPNTASIDDLCRLGFSPKQAASIDSYRKKGGRFNRKEDFAESYVVSDSIYRRLESYIQIPLTDLNIADSAAFDALPGIGGWFASKMIEHRERLKGYSYKEQLMDISRFDQQKFDALCDLVVISEENVSPYPLWELPADSLCLHPYIGDYAAEGIVLYRQNNPRQLWTIEGLKKAGVLDPDHAVKLERCLIRQP